MALFALALEALASYLPADSRARLVCTHPALRACEPLRKSFLRLDLSPRSGGVTAPVTDGMLLGLAALAGGRLEALDVRVCTRVTRDALRAVIAANLGALREVYSYTREEYANGLVRGGAAALSDSEDDAVVDDSGSDQPRAPEEESTLECADISALLTAAPRLRALEALAEDGSTAVVESLLRGTAQPPGALRLTRLRLGQCTADLVGGVISLMQRAAHLPIGQELPPSPPRAESLLRITVLTHAEGAAMDIEGGNRLSRAVTWAALVRALVAHPTLRELSLGSTPFLNAPFAEALGALIGADAPALRTLRVDAQGVLSDAVAGPLVKALAKNTHLEVLELGAWQPDLSSAFVRDQLLPALAANTALRELRIGSNQPLPALREAEAMVAARARV